MAKVFIWFGFILVILTGIVVYQWPEEKLTMTMCNVGQGDAIILSKNFSQWLIDTGAISGGVESCLGNVLPFWDRTIEVVLITHPDADHSGALSSILDRYSVKTIITSPDVDLNIADDVLHRLNVVEVVQGDELVWEGTQGKVVWPPSVKTTGDEPSTNERSIVLRIVYGKSSVWLAGDVDEKIEQQLLKQGLVEPSMILKVAHHGARTATSKPFLELLQPHQAWISVGRDNRYDHPHKDVLGRLEEIGAGIVRTDELNTSESIVLE